MKKVLTWFLVIVLSVSLAACTSAMNRNRTAGEVVSPAPDGVQPEITILFTSKTDLEEWNGNFTYYKYKMDFEKAYGVKVNYEVLPPETSEASEFFTHRTFPYRERLAARLEQKNGPELIYKDSFVPMESPSIQKAVVNLRGKIANLDHIYDGLLGNEAYYIPISMLKVALVTNQSVFKDVGIKEPGAAWNVKDYIKARKLWAAKSERFFTIQEFGDIVSSHIYDLNLFEENKAKINTPEVKERINAIRDEILSGKYKLDSTYTYENYNNMFFEESSEEFNQVMELIMSDQYQNDCFLRYASGNPLNPKLTGKLLAEGNVVSAPPYPAMRLDIMFNAFMVNKNGENLDLAYAFVDGLLSRKIQMEIYNANNSENDFFYPVSKEIEAEIKMLESQEKLDPKAIALKDYVLGNIKNGKFQLYSYKNEKEESLYFMWYSDMLKFIFTDKPYADMRLSNALQALEDKYNMILNE